MALDSLVPSQGKSDIEFVSSYRDLKRRESKTTRTTALISGIDVGWFLERKKGKYLERRKKISELQETSIATSTHQVRPSVHRNRLLALCCW